MPNEVYTMKLYASNMATLDDLINSHLLFSRKCKTPRRQTQAGKQADTGRQAVRLAGKHIGRLEAD